MLLNCYKKKIKNCIRYQNRFRKASPIVIYQNSYFTFQKLGIRKASPIIWKENQREIFFSDNNIENILQNKCPFKQQA